MLKKFLVVFGFLFFLISFANATICDSGDYLTTCYVNSVKNIPGDINLSNLVLNAGAKLENTTSIIKINATGDIILNGSSNINANLILIGNNLILNGSSSITGFSKKNSTFNFTGDVNITGGSYIHSNLFLYSNNLFVDTNSYISSDYLGYKGGSTNSNGEGPGGGVVISGYPYSSGSGGSYGGKGSDSSKTSSRSPYGDIFNPLDYGSGGAGSSGTSPTKGGDGGGLLYFNISNSFDLFGKLSSNGGNGLNSYRESGGGSGGSILIDANIFTNNGELSVIGGSTYENGGGGSGGRISIFSNTYNDNSKIYRLYGGDGYKEAEPGTLMINGVYWICDEGNYTDTCIVKSPKQLYENISLNHLIFNKSYSNLVASLIKLENNKSYQITSTGNVSLYNDSYIHSNLFLYANNLFVDTNSYISSDYLGYDGVIESNGNGPGGGIGGSAYSEGSGGGYGGKGGASTFFSGGVSYGSLEYPLDYGSAGGGCRYSLKGGSGGGLLYLNISNILILNGKLSSNGENGRSSYRYSGGGSGGSILIDANIFTNNGELSVIGGNGVTNSGGGSGGRIAFYCGDHDNSKIYNYIYKSGGIGYQAGEKGTFYNHNDICQIIPLVDYIYPTPLDDAKISKNNITIRVESLRDLNSCKITFNGTNYSMSKLTSRICEGVLNTSNLDQKTKYSYFVVVDFSDDIGNFQNMPSRYFTNYWDNEKINQVPSFGLFSVIILVLILLGGLL